MFFTGSFQDPLVYADLNPDFSKVKESVSKEQVEKGGDPKVSVVFSTLLSNLLRVERCRVLKQKDQIVIVSGTSTSFLVVFRSSGDDLVIFQWVWVTLPRIQPQSFPDFESPVGSKVPKLFLTLSCYS